MKTVGKTLGKESNVDVYECEFCGTRSIYPEIIRRCEIDCHHREEAEVGCI